MPIPSTAWARALIDAKGRTHYDTPPPGSAPDVDALLAADATCCRLAVLPRDQLDSQALLGVAAQQTGRLRAQTGG